MKSLRVPRPRCWNCFLVSRSTLNGDGLVAKIDLGTRSVVRRVGTGQAPRSMTISPDGSKLFVVNYLSNTMSEVRTTDMRVVQTVPTNPNPIGITYDADSRRVWVACYTGSIMVFRDGVSSNRNPVALVSAALRASYPRNVVVDCDTSDIPDDAAKLAVVARRFGPIADAGRAGWKSASSIISRFGERTDAR